MNSFRKKKKIPDNYLQLIVEFCGILLSLMNTQTPLLTSLSSAKLFRKEFMANPLLQKLENQ